MCRQDSIEKTIELAASVERVWRALTDHQEFGEWFRVELEGPFVVGEESRGQITYPGYEHLEWRAMVVAMEPNALFSYTWHAYDGDSSTDHADAPPTLVEFRLEATSGGTRLVISESGFSALPDDKVRENAFRRNSDGWESQTKNIAAYVES